MYITTLTLHNYVRWLVLVAMFYALIRVWLGLVGNREWTKNDDRVALAVTLSTSLQFILGIILYLLPMGLAQAARQNFGMAMKIRDLRFFGLEHPLQMIIALTFVHLGSARARKAYPSARQFRWAVICFTIAALLILIAIPWWRPMIQGF
jgi:hypothetical protein